EDENEKEGDDEGGFSAEISTHWDLFSGLFGSVHSCDGGFHDFEPDVVGREAELDGVVFDGEDGAAEAAIGSDAVAGLDFGEHRLPFFLAGLIGADEEEI